MRRPGLAPAGEVLFFASPKKSTQKKGDPTVCDPFASLRGHLGGSHAAGTAGLAPRLPGCAQTSRGFFDAPNEPDPESEEGVYFEALITLIEAYEAKNFPILDAAKADFNEGCRLPVTVD